MLGRLISGIFQSIPRTGVSSQITAANVTQIWNPWSLTSVRNIVRYHFPHPNERKRIKRHGWLARLKTPGGRKILQRRILKGKHVLSH
ncbi:39S ribosomal protein L34, mitochondrial [Pseudomyrmex gracilis]|uniref:39S ribosomal protein L34, mitochondrial n=1 Tax=Pseudomyrmex gracilis TaxID=219809 RepID=UPI000994F021|nr:39S ribosomal protein L34, mitochondrial [Pseudomyrmex gracilis]